MNTKLLKKLKSYIGDVDGVWIGNNGSSIRVVVDLIDGATVVMFKSYENRIVFDKKNNVTECTYNDLYLKLFSLDTCIYG